MTKLDEISRAIGSLESSVSGIKGDVDGITRRMDKREHIQDLRHQENQETIETHSRENRLAIEASKQAVQDVMDIVRPLSVAVATMTPIVEGLQVTRWKAVGALGMATALLYFLGWAVSAFAIKGVSWLVALFKP